jgi:hydrogenase expression/formation protein HypE
MEITLGHGAGGELTDSIIKELILPEFSLKKAGLVGLEELDDGATITLGDKEIVITTDGHTVKPLFFPGGDIGKLAVCGTINDLAVMGAKPLALTNAMVMQEGFPSEELEKILKSMDAAAKEVGAAIIAGDTKVMERSALDGMVITTTGIGVAEEVIRDGGIQDGDKIIVTGTVGDHGVALMSFREGFGFESSLESDVDQIWTMVEKALEAGGITAMKDPTRGGLAGVLNEWAGKARLGIEVRANDIPLREEVVSAGEMLGIDPFIVASEGKAVMAVRPEKAEEVLEAIRSTPQGRKASIIGEVTGEHRGRVVLETEVGGRRILEPPIGDPVPRVC